MEGGRCTSTFIECNSASYLQISKTTVSHFIFCGNTSCCMKPYHTVNVLHIPMKLGNVVNGVL